MKLTKLSVLLSSLYFGLVGSSYSSDSATMTFRESVDTVCGVKMARNQEGTIRFNDEGNAQEQFVKFTPTSNERDKTLSVTFAPFSGSISLVNGQSVGENEMKLWVGVEGSKPGDFGSLADKYEVESDTEYKAIAAVNHSKSEITESDANYTITTIIQLDCL
ncbi:hypothetical protein GTG28_14165 [Vibrio sp. OCN044]|uniref:Uncharacterized protein n=1 Tax=Vibrio tetraodonis subsp. pristinus TaxID=2695891 RepID=A0A6L8LX63_9VIBR|nr:hypothetical protein [Vibrio tetraodonis]MYM60375.1 hypothetical protein [Vibrio tetraodonis subsp. pristinus]